MGLLLSLYARLVRLAGGRPEVVLPLTTGLLRDAAGQNKNFQSRRRRKGGFTAEVIRLLTLVVAAMVSVVFPVIMLAKPPQMHPPVVVIALVAVHFVAVLMLVMNQVGPAMLAARDEEVMGWWPVTRRELLLARLSLLLKPALEVTVALTLIPVICFLFAGRPPVLAAITLALGLLLQTLGVVFGLAGVLMLILRLIGRRKSERLAGMLSDGNGLLLLYLPLFLGDKIFPWFHTHTWVVYLLPPVWFSGWGDPLVAGRFRILALMGLLASLLAIVLGVRAAATGTAGMESRSVESRPGRFSLSGLIAGALRPMMPGTEGWAVRKLLQAHLREDWRFIGAMASFPLMMIFFSFIFGGEVCDPEDLAHSALVEVGYLYLVLMMGATSLHAVQFSSTPEAMWPLALADLDTDRILTAQRAMIRGLIFVPTALVYVFSAARLGAGWWVIGKDLALLLLELEMILLFLQPWFMQMPFSTRYQEGQAGNRIVAGLLSGGVMMVFLILDMLYVYLQVVHYGVWLVLPPVWWLLRRRLRRKAAAEGRLAMDVVME